VLKRALKYSHGAKKGWDFNNDDTLGGVRRKIMQWAGILGGRTHKGGRADRINTQGGGP